MIELFEIDKEKHRFIVKSKSGTTLLNSIDFKNKEEVEQTVLNLTSTSNAIKRIERKTNFDGKFLFDVKNNEGKTIGSSGLYSSEAGMENGIKNLRNSLSANL
ncbi:YegP family protein [Maribacter sp. 2210JD10-5]|uniref:YegP family protein n=1 Tax=Maribacter sp. 2210JD10-5 TaxID=3386272 RepID=UPI0039BCF2E0